MVRREVDYFPDWTAQYVDPYVDFKYKTERLELHVASPSMVGTHIFNVLVERLDKLDHLVRQLVSGDYCGEVGIIYERNRTATVQASSYSTVGMVDKKYFLGLIQNNKELKGLLRENITGYHDPYRLGIHVFVI